MDPEDLLAEAQRRLTASKSSPVAMKHVNRLQSQYSLPDDAILGLRLLKPAALQRFVTVIEKDVAARLSSCSPGQCASVLKPHLLKLDSAVPGMVAKLKQLDSQGTQLPSSANSEDEAVETARARLQNQKLTSVQSSKIKKLKEDFGLGDEIVLAMRMLEPPMLKELLDGEAHIRQKLASDKDPANLMMWLISQLDAEVETLVRKLVELDNDGAQPPSAPAKPALPPKAKALSPKPPLLPPGSKPPLSSPAGQRLPENGSPKWAALLKQVYSKFNASKLPELPAILEKYQGVEKDLYEALARKYGFPADKLPPTIGAPATTIGKRTLNEPESQVKKARVDSEDSTSDGAYASAQQRLEKNKSPAQNAALAKLKLGNKFSDEVLLALKLIPTYRLQELAGRHRDLKHQLDAAQDRNQCMMSIIWAIDPEVQTMVRKLVDLDNSASAPVAATSASNGPRPVGKLKEPGMPPAVRGSVARPPLRPHAPKFGKGH